jgi:hypothetical protein
LSKNSRPLSILFYAPHHFIVSVIIRLAQISIENYTTLIEYILVLFELFELSVVCGASGLTQLYHAQSLQAEAL